MTEKSDNNYYLFVKEYTAEQFRSGENIRGETYQLWLKELSEKCDFTIASLNILYKDVEDHYRYEKGLTREDSLTNYEISAIAKRVEKAIERLPYLEEQRRIDIQKKKNRKNKPFGFLKRLLSFLTD